MTLHTIEDLITSGVARVAMKPKDNAAEIGKRVTVSVVAEDYPARSPSLWNASYRAFGIKAAHLMLVALPERAPLVLAALREDRRYLGGGMGVRWKTAAVPLLDELDEVAREVGAMNVVVKTAGGALRGFNTDGNGYAASLATILALTGRAIEGSRVLMIGAGGTANAIAFALAGRGARLVIVNRTPEKAAALAQAVNAHFAAPPERAASGGAEGLIAEAAPRADVIVNVSTKGGAGEYKEYSALAPSAPGELDKNLARAEVIFKTIPRTTLMSDIILGEGDTPFLKRAKALGFSTLDGVAMAIEQGVLAFSLVHRAELEEQGISKGDIGRVMRGVER